ncbi:MAG TPA: zinc ribbon domain-containing protein, partial [Thermoplasmata archaeon]|nr:zinc ribbon domain-containing protein [Thermoplasmata archaeon]
DANQTVTEQNEANNDATAPITIVPPQGSVRIEAPSNQQAFRPGDVVGVRGVVLQTGAFEGTPIGGVAINVTLLNPQGQVVPGVGGNAVTASNDGSFLVSITLLGTLPDGTYTVRVDALDSSIQDRDRSIVVKTDVPWWAAPFLGLPVWIWLIVIIGAAAAIGGGTAYVKFVGLGKLVECGECGAFIPEDSAKCPKCGVEFEKDMAKCSNCQAWIPVDVKQCPECGVEFATGEVEMADYEAQMRRQYDDVKKKFREDASRELGRALSEREFEDWWRAQPTFVTFEDWLREEEEMRRMGSKPCPVCNTLNSVTATVCHKCGTLLKEDTRRGGGGGARPPAAGPRAAATGPVAQQPPSGGEAEGAPGEAIPKKVVKKPVMGAPVVQKKVIKRPIEEDKEGEGGEGTSSGDEEQI